MAEKAKRFHQKVPGCLLADCDHTAGGFVFALTFLPDLIPAHYDAAGAVHRWGSKAELFYCLVFQF